MDEPEKIHGIVIRDIYAGTPPPRASKHVNLKAVGMAVEERVLSEELDGCFDMQCSEQLWSKEAVESAVHKY